MDGGDKSDRGTVDLDPGIYSRGISQDKPWEKCLLKGHVLGGEHTRGITQLTMTRDTSRRETLAVIDGKIHVFHLNSTPEDNSSFIVVGDEAHPVVDSSLYSNPSVVLPTIKSLEDITILPMLPRFASQDILVSVKDPSPHFLGRSGITFIIRIKSESLQSLSLSSPVWILDYKFRSVSDLENLDLSSAVRFNARQYLSENWVERLIQKDLSDPIFIQHWKRRVGESLQEYPEGSEKMPFSVRKQEM